LLEQNPEKINWEWLSLNPNAKAIKLLEKNPEKITWRGLSENPGIIVDYLPMAKQRNATILQELMEKTWHPKRMVDWCLEYNDTYFEL
jgi:hypothetical protein